MVANPSRGQLNRENECSLFCTRSRLRIEFHETGLAVPTRASRSFSTLRLNLVLNREIPHAFRDGLHIHYCPTAKIKI